MVTLFKNLIAKKITSVFLLVCLSLTSFKGNAFSFVDESIKLPAGTRVDLELVPTINSTSISAGETVDFKVRQDVIIGGKVVISAGTIAKGNVISAEKPKGLGKEGKVEVQVKSVPAVDGTIIPLSSSSLAREGDDKSTISILLGIFVCLLFLLMKGKDGIIPSGTTVEAVVASNIEINV